MQENTETHRTSNDTFPEESLEELYEDAPCGYVSTLPDGTFIKVNRTFLEWIGYQRAELLSDKHFQDLLPLVGKVFYETHHDPLLHMQGFVNEIAVDLVCRDGQRLPVLINSVQKRDASGKPLLNRITVFKATDRREYERELQVARKKVEQALLLRDQFLSLASHELRTPVTTILGNIELLQRRINRENTLSARDQRTLQTIADQTRRLSKMLVSLLDVSRIEMGQLTIERQTIDVCALVSRVVDEVQPMLSKHQIQLNDWPQPLVIQGDELRLEQVLQNLIQNAAKYSGPTAPIVVEVSQRGRQVCVAVHDRGIGIPQVSLPHVFERFYRAGNVHKEHVGGMGIGLYVVKQIVELHGGEVTVKSAEGLGSTFTVSFPLDATALL